MKSSQIIRQRPTREEVINLPWMAFGDLGFFLLFGFLTAFDVKKVKELQNNVRS